MADEETGKYVVTQELCRSCGEKLEYLWVTPRPGKWQWPFVYCRGCSAHNRATRLPKEWELGAKT